MSDQVTTEVNSMIAINHNSVSQFIIKREKVVYGVNIYFIYGNVSLIL